MKNLITLQGNPVKTYREMYNAMYPIEGSCSRGRQTVIGQFRLKDETIIIYHHWSTLGFQVYTDEKLTNCIAEVGMGEWYPWLDENGNQQKEFGTYGCDLYDCEISFIYKDDETSAKYEN